MKTKFIPIVFTMTFVSCFFTRSFAQKKDLVRIADSITREGRILYRSEWASWYGTDIFVAKCAAKKELTGGYLSYNSGTGLTNIFFSKGSSPVVLATTSFGYDLKSSNYTLDTTSRKLTPLEEQLYTIRQAALAKIYSDTSFRIYKNTSLNLVPIIINNTRRVYVLSGSKINGLVVFGNDYLFEFDADDHLISEKKIHKSFIPIKANKRGVDSTKTDVASIHTHSPETGDFITATDVCTLMLYENFTTWDQHIVVSKNYVSVWDCKKNHLLILTAEAWKKISASANTYLKN
ncbi:hypothetical protein HDF18_23435 [Mucilaginibacter sp. X5P1]|uniref:hypothetical protein n=1 Tax=Mucilaginibacter sp. X5P1 TaxID=2723088 RepID=UPI00161514EC|nr:hypothetical protein [Mucilaginibacter sp. X5P1]MBB6141325.1 hypothetical protein [Mucilaginibacter sp. X5P1]